MMHCFENGLAAMREKKHRVQAPVFNVQTHFSLYQLPLSTVCLLGLDSWTGGQNWTWQVHVQTDTLQEHASSNHGYFADGTPARGMAALWGVRSNLQAERQPRLQQEQPPDSSGGGRECCCQPPVGATPSLATVRSATPRSCSNCSHLWFPCLLGKCNHSARPPGLLWGLNEVIHGKPSTQRELLTPLTPSSGILEAKNGLCTYLHRLAERVLPVNVR